MVDLAYKSQTNNFFNKKLIVEDYVSIEKITKVPTRITGYSQKV